VTHLVSGQDVACINWDMFRDQFDSRYQHARQVAIWNAFWLCFPYHVNYHLFQLLVDDFHLKIGFVESL
jgi:hypothetical protein